MESNSFEFLGLFEEKGTTCINQAVSRSLKLQDFVSWQVEFYWGSDKHFSLNILCLKKSSLHVSSPDVPALADSKGEENLD